jgi:hypothetical protein
VRDDDLKRIAFVILQKDRLTGRRAGYIPPRGCVWRIRGKIRGHLQREAVGGVAVCFGESNRRRLRGEDVDPECCESHKDNGADQRDGGFCGRHGVILAQGVAPQARFSADAIATLKHASHARATCSLS